MNVAQAVLCARKDAFRCRALVLALLLTGVFAIPALASTTTVKVGDNYYVRDGSSPTVKVKRNDLVRWVFVGTNVHTVTTRGKAPRRFDSGIRGGALAGKNTYLLKMRKIGTYRIYCKIHGAKDQSMVLTVTR